MIIENGMGRTVIKNEIIFHRKARNSNCLKPRVKEIKRLECLALFILFYFFFKKRIVE